ncbi:hypothetical protein [Streptomyces sp. VRA16 Mangrove soil]|uniref:hypothetical protein n=1 Tax=Streptomyces sp. VRA16 Mangrove soil TaxID=2817434 RepID=UPI001A9ECBC7|nr:hypothetical protein [Streptomyces sp. VRA16 Mangrove soil]MBO1332085.1 hypothetical protein [Streptomyces sp. VRA16 Mangrove soil]
MPRLAVHALLVTLLVTVLGCAQAGADAGTPYPAPVTTAASQAAPVTPGCDPEQRHAPDSRQGVPSRGTSAHELLAPLAHDHGSGATAVLDGIAPAAPEGRGPPPHDPPTPVQLSVLRV